MVFPTISESEPSVSTLPMASIASSKSQPLHNFSLTDLKWSPAHHRFRRQSGDSAPHSSPLRDFTQPRPVDPDSDGGGCRQRALNDLPPPFPTKNPVEAPAALNGKSSKITLRFRAPEKPVNPPAPAEAAAAQGKVPATRAETEELTSKVWNLRPRKQITKKSSTGHVMAGAVRVAGAVGPEISAIDVARLRNRGEAEKGEAKERKVMKLSIPLTKEEIEADFRAFTGSRPARRPKKRPRIIQRTLDFCFPGLLLANITADSYKVVDNPPKG